MPRPAGSKNLPKAEGKPASQRTPYFFMGRKPYKRIEVRAHENLMIVYDFEEERESGLLLSDVRRFATPCYSFPEAAEIINRKVKTIQRACWQGKLPLVHRPNVSKPGNRPRRLWMISEEDILDWWEYFAHLPQGGLPRKDGRERKPRKNLPSKAELLAKFKKTTVTYIKNSKGEMVPVWSEDAYI